MKSKKRVTALLLAAGILTTNLCPTRAFAAGPLSDKVNSGYDEETWARLNDNVIEYDEVPTLVHEFNSTISQTWDTLRDAQEDLRRSVEELESYQFKQDQLLTIETEKIYADIEAGNISSDDDKKTVLTTLGINQANVYNVVDGLISSMRKASSNVLSRTTRNSLQKAENQITMIVQSLMITYDSTRKQRDMVEQLQKLYDRQYELTLNQQSQGLATLQDVVTANSNQISALSTLQTIDSGLMQMKPTICSLTGWNADDNPEIGEIPTVDLSKIDAINLEEDTRKAIGNNTELISQRNSAAGKTSDGIQARLGVIDEGDQKMTIKMKSLYDDVFAKKSAYEGAKAGFEAAQKQADSYARMYEVGFLSEADYLGTQIAYYQKKASYVSADTALRLAIETYNWAVKGLVNAD